jgi:hypothetical protein
MNNKPKVKHIIKCHAKVRYVIGYRQEYDKPVAVGKIERLMKALRHGKFYASDIKEYCRFNNIMVYRYG